MLDCHTCHVIYLSHVVYLMTAFVVVRLQPVTDPQCAGTLVDGVIKWSVVDGSCRAWVWQNAVCASHSADMQLQLSCVVRKRLRVVTWSTTATWQQCSWMCLTSWRCVTALCTSVSSCWVHQHWPARWSDIIISCISSSAVSVIWLTACLSTLLVSHLQHLLTFSLT